MKNGITGLEKLRNLQGKVAQRAKYINDLNGTPHDMRYADFSIGPVLHQDGENMSEEEGAMFQKNNPEVVAFLQSLKFKLDSILREV